MSTPIVPDVPTPTDQVPRWLQRLARLVLRLWGWRVEKWALPPDAKKVVVIGEHHTSNWDSVLMLFLCAAMGRKLSWLVKSELDQPVLGALIRATGGVFVDRHAKRGTVAQVIDKINQSDHIFLVLAPSGTRSKTERWRSGFYHIAQGADVPLGLGYADYDRKAGGVGRLMMLSGDIEADLEVFREFYADVTPLFPEKASAVHMELPNSLPAEAEAESA